MTVSCKKHWKLLIDRDMKKKDLKKTIMPYISAVIMMGIFTFLFLG